MLSLNSIAKILIVDDHPMVCEALGMRISMEKDFEVCGETGTEAEALQMAEELGPDLVIVDISLREGNGIRLIKKLSSAHPHIKILVFSTHPETLYAERALRAGALGYLNKQESAERVTTAIREVLKGNRYLSPETTDHLLNLALGNSDINDSPVNRLTDRELEVFRLIGEGLTSSEAASKLGISISTIDTYREKIKHKIGARNGVELQREAVLWVMEQS